MREREPRRVQELALEPVAAGAAVLRVARDRVPDGLHVRADLMRAARLQPHAQQRVRGQRPLDDEVGDRGARLVRLGGDAGAHAAVAAERGVDRPAPRRRAARRRAPGTRAAIARSAICALSAAWAAASRASTSRPEVSRSSRCTTPGRSGSSPPATRPASACTSVPGSVAARGMHDDAGAACRPRGRARPPRRSRTAAAARRGAPAAGGASTATRSPPASAWRLGRATPSTVTWPASISRCAAEREPAWPREEHVEALPRGAGGTVSSGTALDHEDQGHDAAGDGDVGDVEGRPVRQLDEVGHRAVVGAVDQVAQRAADSSPVGQPDQRPARVRGEEGEQRDQRGRRRPPPRARRRRTGSRRRCRSCAR